MMKWNKIETCPQEELVYVFGRHKTGEAWFNIGTLWGDDWDGQWIKELTPTHWMRLVEPENE